MDDFELPEMQPHDTTLQVGGHPFHAPRQLSVDPPPISAEWRGNQHMQNVHDLRENISEKHHWHQHKFKQFKTWSKFVLFTTTLLNLFGISSLAVHFAVSQNQTAAIVGTVLNTVGFIISGLATAYQLGSKEQREMTLATQYLDLKREVDKRLIVNHFTIPDIITLLERITEKLQLIEDYESTV